jgi:predicted alpha/beta-fold hydrolase
MERWDTPDGDFLDLQRLDAPTGSPRLLILHGLEGSPRSHYARGLMAEAYARGWAADLLVFRSCGTEPNRALRFYHSGETTDLDFVVRQLVAREPDRPIVMAGVSLGGNVLLKWLGERGPELPGQLRGAATVSVPYDLARGARYIDRGFARVYQAHFLRTLKRKALEKQTRFPDALSTAAIRRSRSLFDFDDVVTAPIHGFRDALDYYTRSSSLGFLAAIRLPTLLRSAVDDPFLPPEVLREVAALARDNPALEVELVDRGGHVGFISGRVPWRPLYYAEWRVTNYLAGRVDAAPRAL